jgi:hypothetical protein
MVRGNIRVFLPLSLAKTHLIQDASHGSRNIQAITLLRLVIHTSVDKIGKRDKNVLQLSSLSTFLRAKTHLIQDASQGSFTIQAIRMLKHASVDKVRSDQNLIRYSSLFTSLWLKPILFKMRAIDPAMYKQLHSSDSVRTRIKTGKDLIHFNSLVFQHLANPKASGSRFQLY